MRAAIGVQQHRQRAVGRVVLAGQQQSAAQVAVAEPEQFDVEVDLGVLGSAADLGDLPPGAPHPHPGARLVERGRGDHEHLTGARSGVHTGLLGHLLGTFGGDAEEVDLGRVLLRGGDQDVVVADVEDAPDLQGRCGPRLIADDQPVRAVVGADAHQAAVRAPGGPAGFDLHPVLVGVAVHLGGLAGAGVEGQDELGALVTALHRDQRAAVPGPVGGDEVREGPPVPVDVHPVTVEVEDGQRHVGVGGPGGRIAHGGRLAGRVGRITEIPVLHRGFVHARRQQPRSVRGPPVAAVAVHFLGGDELRGAPRDVRAFWFGERVVAGTVHIDHAQLTAGEVGHPATVGIRPGIGHRLRHREFAGGAGRDVGDEQPSRQREGRQSPVAVGRVAGDAAGPFPRAFAAGLFGR